MTISKRLVKALKHHSCWRCGRGINVGDHYVRLFGSSDDSLKNPKPSALKECMPCRKYYFGETVESLGGKP